MTFDAVSYEAGRIRGAQEERRACAEILEAALQSARIMEAKVSIAVIGALHSAILLRDLTQEEIELAKEARAEGVGPISHEEFLELREQIIGARKTDGEEQPQ